ncbi:MAG TPA: shikimate dehydrogenase, partial [Pyrinomonadaceae bacterium]|nr:shikimate dehydrogenase [Pyrinomonadaceae bacterium]
INQETEIFGIIGNHVGSSLSPRIHNAAFAAVERNAVYIPFAVHDADQFIRRMVHPASREIEWNLRGLSVTTPHKLAVIQGLDEIDTTAGEIGAVNTIVVRDGRLLGYNTDAAGFIAPLGERYGALQNARCAVIGAGGAAQACLWALQKEGAECVLFARNREKALALAQAFNVECRQAENADFGGFDIVINATSLGMRGATEGATPAGVEQLRGVRLAYDLVYNPLQTRFLSAARDAGCETLGGFEMLLSQAVEQFRLWTGREPDVGVMRASAFAELSE